MHKDRRAFTVVEMLISMAIMGLVLALAVVEFSMVFNHNKLTTANMTAEQNARIAMAKVSNELRQAMPDITDTTPPYVIVTQPTEPPASTAPSASQTVTFTRVDNGAQGLSASPMPTDTNGNPRPCYDTVSLAYDPVGKTITKTVTLITNTNCSTASNTSSVIAWNVANFSVTYVSPTMYDVDLQTQETAGNYNVYDLNTQVALGYKQ